jgi:hypothetical protein
LSERQESLPPAANDVVFIGAIAAIFRGDLETGIGNISALADEGYERAAATYAQLLAYQGRWEEAGEYAGIFLLNPASGSSHDMYLDAWRLLTLSAMHTGQWEEAINVVSQAKSIYANAITKKKNPRLKYLNVFSKFIRTGGSILGNAGNTGNTGNASNANGSVSGHTEALPYPIFPATTFDATSAEQHFATLERYHIDCGEAARAWPQNHLQEVSARQDLYTAAMDYNLPQKNVGFYRHCKTPPEGYNQLLFLAKSLVLDGAKSDAREVLEMAVNAYIPHDLANILPVAVFWDPSCRVIAPLIRADKVFSNKLKKPVKSLHKIHTDKIAAIDSRNQHLLQLAKQASFTDIHQWEEQLAGDEGNIDLRKLLIICYRDRITQYLECAEKHAKHVFWIIQKAPQSTLAGDDYCMLINRGQTAYYKRGKELWLNTLRKPGSTTQMVRNAAQYLRYDASG